MFYLFIFKIRALVSLPLEWQLQEGRGFSLLCSLLCPHCKLERVDE